MRRPLTTLAVAITLTVTACATDHGDAGGNNTSATDLDFPGFLQVVENMATAESMNFEMVLTYHDIPELDGVEITTAGSIHIDNQSSAITMDMEAMFAAMQGELTDDDRERIAGAGDIVQEGSTTYMRAGLLYGTETAWVSVDTAVIAEIAGKEFDTVMGAQPADPMAQIEALRSASDDWTAAGNDEIRGVQALRIDATLDYGELLDAMGSGLEAMFDTYGVDTQELANLRVPFSTWIDADGLVRRMEVTLQFADIVDLLDVPASQADEVKKASISTRMDYYAFGDADPIDVPPADDVTDITDMAAQMLQNS